MPNDGTVVLDCEVAVLDVLECFWVVELELVDLEVVELVDLEVVDLVDLEVTESVEIVDLTLSLYS